MKTRLWLVLGVTLLFIMSSCNEDKVISNNQLVKSISFTGQDFLDGDAVNSTRAAYTVDGTGFHFTWSQGDTVGIYPVGGDQVAFPISSGEGSQTAQFDGGAWALRSSYSYAAYYPFSSDNYKAKESAIPVSYIGQVQNGNGSLDCLDRFDFQASVATNPDVNGNVNIALKHLGCFVRFQLTMPSADTYKSITLKSSKTPFITSGTFDLTNDSIHINPVATSQTISINLNNTSTTEHDSILVVYTMLAPADMSDSKIDITIFGTEDSIYTMSVTGKKMVAGKAYSYKTGITQTDYQLAAERKALIAIYKALDGDKWNNNENWCSNKPVGEWYGIQTNSNGFVYSIDLYDNNLTGQIPSEIGNFPYLSFLRFRDDEINGYIPVELFKLSRLVDLTLCGLYFDDGTIPSEINNLTRLEDLQISSLKSEIVFPSNLEGLKNLRNLFLGYHSNTIQPPTLSLSFVKDLKNLDWLSINYMRLTIPECIGELRNLNRLDITNCIIDDNTIPSTIGNLQMLKILDLSFNTLSCELPKEIGNLTQLEFLNLYQTNFTGNIPVEFSNLTSLKTFQLGYNSFSGKLSQEVAELPVCQTMWPSFFDHTGLDLSACHFPAPDFNVYDLDENNIQSDKLYSENKLTILYEWATWCPIEETYSSILKSIYNDYQNDGIYILGYAEEDSQTDENTARQFVTQKQYPWPNVFWHYDNPTATAYNEIYRITVFPLVCVFDQNHRIVFNTYADDIYQLRSFISDYLSDGEWYTSIDYSSDGVVTPLQQSITGSGIDIVLMGDGFSDRQIADGTYAGVMHNAMNAFFSEEPYKSYKSNFNVYYVNVVSATEGYEHSGQALGTRLGEGTNVYGNDAKVIEYAKKAIPESKLDDALIIVMMNEDSYAGTCFMYDAPDGNYGRGLSIAYFPVNSNLESFNGLVLHEAGGHGFAKLADEYAYEENGTITQDDINTIMAAEPFGWWKNIDFTNNTTRVKWAQFISDSRYVNENIGCYEGGLTYWSGVWRPTENSIMRYNTGGFNAPSRYAIWYRINKLAYGESWNGTYEDFVEYDAINRTSSGAPRRTEGRRNYVEKPLPALAPPVVVGHSWREAK